MLNTTKLMCGLAGIFLFNKNNNKEGLSQIEAMTDLLVHRGPDDKGYYISDKVALGHRRLAIIDLSKNGGQPMFNEDASAVLIFNGEIYNFKKLKSLLVSKGHTFRSDSDSEVILHLYEEYDHDCVKYLEGMFAFAIYDIKRESILLARDRIGEKPLFYFRDQNGFYFSSELKSFFALKNFNRKLSIAGFHAYFNYIQIPAPQTIFEGVDKVRPAHWLRINSDGGQSTDSYWHVDCVNKTKITLLEAKDQLEVILKDAVEKMLISDVPVGILLSGGVDSSLVLGLAIEAGRNDIKTFTVGNNAIGSQDLEFLRAKQVIAKYNLKHYVYDFSESNFSDLIVAATLCDEPIGLLEIFYQFGIFGYIKNHVKVVLTGNGADEVFAGYSSYTHTRRLSDMMKIFHAIIHRNNNLFNHGAASFNVFNKGRTLRKLYSDRIIQSNIKRHSERLLSVAMELVSYSNILDAKLFMDLFVLCNHALTGIPDTAGMSQSIEVRSPFLHHKVIEFASTLPAELKVQDSRDPLYNKPLLKELACKYLDRENVYVEKYGFGRFINTFDLMKTKWRSEIEDTIFDSKLVQADLFNMDYINAMWKSFIENRISINERLLFARLVMFCVWHKYNFSLR